MEHKMQQAAFKGKHDGEVVGWVRPRLSGEEEAAIRERLIRQRFEHVDEYLVRIDECQRELVGLGALDGEAAEAIREARSAVVKLRSNRSGLDAQRANT